MKLINLEAVVEARRPKGVQEVCIRSLHVLKEMGGGGT
jgi:hypothetical protein